MVLGLCEEVLTGLKPTSMVLGLCEEVLTGLKPTSMMLGLCEEVLTTHALMFKDNVYSDRSNIHWVLL
jgi:hypothetical protein